MNKRNDYKILLDLANEDLAKTGRKIILNKEDESYTLFIQQKNGDTDCFAEGYYEEELSDLINDAWAHAKAKPEKAGTKKTKKDQIRALFDKLPEENRTDLLAELYLTLPDYWKDRFLDKTGNN